MDLRKYLGSQIKTLRKQAGISQEQLAVDIGMAKNSIYLLEKGQVWPEYENLQAIAAKLDVQPEKFFSGLTNDARAEKPGLAPAALPLADLEKELRNLNHGHALKLLQGWIVEAREINEILKDHKSRKDPSQVESD